MKSKVFGKVHCTRVSDIGYNRKGKVPKIGISVKLRLSCHDIESSFGLQSTLGLADQNGSKLCMHISPVQCMLHVSPI
jgi:hypothetical protein